MVLLTTAYRGRPNVMTQSWHTMMEFEPPLVGCVVSNANHSFAALHATRECVIALPALALAPEQVADLIAAGLRSGKGVVWAPAAMRWVALVLRLLPGPLFRRLRV